jgi:hypothetical protein
MISPRRHIVSYAIMTVTHWADPPGRAGSRTVQVLPSPRALTTVMSPPWAWASFRAIERPSPLPPVDRARARSARQNLSKTCGRSAAAMPSPARMGMETRQAAQLQANQRKYLQEAAGRALDK